MLHCGLLGEHLAHSYSPRIYQRLGDFSYELFERAPFELEAFILSCNVDGLNVTIPYKKTVVQWCDTLSPEAEATGSVNTMLFRDGRHIGHNTDAYGFSALLKKSAVEVAGKKVLVLGSGGASAAVQYVLEQYGATSVIISRCGPNSYDTLDRHTDAHLLINATPVGMYPNNGQSRIDLSHFGQCKGVFDLIYNPARTKLLLDAERLGIPAYNGLYMLVAQAKRAAELYLDTTLPDARIEEITKALDTSEQNIILIGMPGCGKSTVGKLLSELTGREFFDCDTELQRICARPIRELLRDEDEFRSRETAVLREICKLSGKIISTGGGAVTRPENYDILRQNGKLVFLDRPIDDLKVEGRPLSLQQGVERLAQQRMSIYHSWADATVVVTTPQATARLIQKELGL